jgi:hypothetical protein
MDIRHRRSISGMVFFLAGAVVAWKTRVQPTIALSTSESEFLAESGTGHLGLFIHTVLDKLLQHQSEATIVDEANDRFCMVSGSTSSTRQMHHISIRDFALQDWTERNIIALTACASNVNASDMFTNQVGKILLTHNNNHISGRTLFFRVNPGPSSCPQTCIWSQGGCQCFLPIVRICRNPVRNT